MTSDLEYFEGVQNALVEAGYSQPVIVLDKNRLDKNLDVLASSAPAHMTVRIVAKSLPSLELLQYVMERVGTERLMTFNLPMLSDLARLMPNATHLLGKPFPVRAAAQFYRDAPLDSEPDVQWLIDTEQRLAQYQELARSLERPLQVSIELDVGLHRGGFTADASLAAALNAVDASPHLTFTGFMGYEAHLAKFPKVGGIRDRALRSSLTAYAAALDLAKEVLPAETLGAAVINTAGSMTFPLHHNTSFANEMSIGSALLKGTDFDLDTLEAFEPSVFIATPVLKVLNGVGLPGMDFLRPLTSRLRPNGLKTAFIHGGHWLAQPVHPSGLKQNSIFGRSSNQEMLNLPATTPIEPDDFVFLRPTQTEAVLMQFGDIAVYDNGKILDTWSVFPASG